MDPKKTPSNIVVSVACGPVPCDSERGRSFLQERQAFFGRICALLALGLYVVLNLVSTFGGTPWSFWLTTRDNLVHLGVCAVFLGMYLTCRKGALSHVSLRVVDVLGTLLLGTLVGLAYTPEDLARHTDYYGGLSITNILLVRAIIIPSSARQTFLTSTLATLPVLVGFHFALGVENTAGRTPGLDTASFAAWCGISIAVATIASSVTYGLQQEVEGAKQLGQYTLEERIGRGGMGEVYRASHVMLRRPTAIKLLRPEKAGERSLARFEREVQLTSCLTHPNTIAIYDYGHTPDGVFYYAMEYLEGLDLEDLVGKYGAQPAARVIHILRQICSSLIEAHGTGLIHRDIKPANVILCERGAVQDVVKVVDFGLVKDVENRQDLSLSAAHSIMGSPLYMSPESIRSPQAVDARSDLYSVGAVGYYLVSGKPVFEAETFVEICGHHLHTPPEPPSTRIDGAVPQDLEKALLQCLEKDPSNRPADARALLKLIDACKDADGWTQEVAAQWWQSSTAQVGSAPRTPAEAETQTVQLTAVVTPPRPKSRSELS